MKSTFASVRPWLVATLGLGFATLLNAATDFTVVSTSIVSETRVGRTTFDYQMRATVRNNGAAIDAFAMRVSSGIATTSAVVNAVNFGPIGAGATATSLDTFTIRHDRTVPFDAGVLSWAELPAPPQPTVTPITGPVGTNSSSINGTAAPGATVEITGGTAVVTTTAHATTGAFSATVGLQTNRINRIYAVAIDGASRRSPPAAIEILHDLQAPSLFIDFPTDGAELTNETIVVAGRVGDLLSGFMGLDVTVNGQTANVIVGIGQNGTFERGAVALVEGANTITAVATDANGNTTTKSISVTRVPLEGPQMKAVSGDGQTGVVNERLAAPVILLVTEADGTTPIANKIVTFTVTRSDGRLFASSVATTTPGVTQLQVLTDASGLARAYWQMGTDAGCGNNRVSVTSRDIAGTINFCASANPAPPSQINIGAGNNQRGEAGAPLPLALRAWVNDSCNGAAGIPVLFTVVSGGGKVNGADAVVIDTSITGHAEVRFTLGPAQGNNVVQATFAGNPGAPATFVAYGLVRVENASTSFSGLVLNNASQPVGGAACTLQIAGQTSRNTTSDVNGRFTFADCPAGTGYVHVNGLPATTAGGATVPTGSFPALSFSVVVVPNVANSLPTPVLLPTLDPANAKIYNGTRDVVLTCQGIAGLKMTIKAGSMTRFDGTKPSVSSPEIITLNQVHHDDVPMPMPDGAAPPFAWTLQPAGATFDPAITIEYPNMSGLPAGAVAYFLSFDHATEKFEIVASGHVTADGSTIVTDPGVGLTISGWGCNCPPYSVATDCEGCEFKCKDPGEIEGGTVEIEKEVVCEGQTLKWTASGAMHVGAEVEIECEDETTTSPYVGITKYKWEISGGALPGPMQGEGATAELPNAMAGEYTCTFTVEVEDAPGAQVSCVPGPKALDPKKGYAVKVELITPKGDPVAAPVDSGDGQNEWTFSSATPGVLTINFKAKFTPNSAPVDKVKDLVVFSMANVGSAPTWDAANPGGKASVSGSDLVAKATFTGLPANNTDFGTKEVKLVCDGTDVETVNIEVFYPKDESNHPGGEAGSPNWYHYWGQALGVANTTYKVGAGLYGEAPGMLQWSYVVAPDKPSVIIYDLAATVDPGDPASDVGQKQTTGIDTFEDTYLHEQHHTVQITNADAVVGIVAATPWRYGWSWNQAPHNHWSVGADGKPGVSGVDDDGDGTIDNFLVTGAGELGNGDDVLLDRGHSWPIAFGALPPMPWAGGIPIEDPCYNKEPDNENQRAALDWGDPGKQHQTVNKYDD